MLKIRVYLHSWAIQLCRRHYGSVVIRLAARKNREMHAKFRQNLTLRQFKVIQGHRSWCQWKVATFISISH